MDLIVQRYVPVVLYLVAQVVLLYVLLAMDQFVQQYRIYQFLYVSIHRVYRQHYCLPVYQIQLHHHHQEVQDVHQVKSHAMETVL